MDRNINIGGLINIFRSKKYRYKYHIIDPNLNDVTATYNNTNTDNLMK